MEASDKHTDGHLNHHNGVCVLREPVFSLGVGREEKAQG